MKVLLLVLFSLFYIEYTFAFNFIDSSKIITVSYNEKHYQLSKANNKPDSTHHYANLLITQYQEKKDPSKVSELYYETAKYLIEKQQYKMASGFLESYVEFAERTGDNEIIAKSYYLTGIFFDLAMINSVIALEYYNKSLAIFKKIGNKDFLARLHLQLGNFYENSQDDYLNAIENYEMGLEICGEHKFHSLLYSFNRQLAEIYRHKLNNYNTSLLYYNKCLQLAEQKNDKSKLVDAFIEIGCVSVQYNKLDSVLYFYNRALELVKKYHLEHLESFCYNHLSVFYETIEDYEKALNYLNKQNSNYVNQEGNWLPQPLLKMAEYERKLGNHERANEYYEKYIHLQDSLDDITKADITSKLELKFELENIEKENLLKEEKSKAVMHRQKTIRNFLFLLTVLLLLLSFLIYRNYINQQKSNKKLNEANKKLHDADKMKLRFFTNISHELRTPLTLLISPIERLKAINPTLVNDGLISTMLNNGKKLKNTINQLLDVSKMDSEKLTLEKAQYSFNNIFRSSTAMFLSTAEEKQISYCITPLQNDLVFSFDKERVEHVISNLLSNAFKYTQKGGEIAASVSKLNNEVLLSIKDTGIGIPQADINNIFNRFYQSLANKSEVYGGTGIGLNIVKEYVELHKGTVSVYSEHGKGSEFLVKLPLIELKKNVSDDEQIFLVDDVFKKTRVKESRIASAEVEETLLIVEDNVDLNNYLTSIFEHNYHVLKASNGKEAIEVTMTNMPDIILSDVMMPDYNGFQLTEYIKSNMETSHIPIILLTAKVGNQDKITGYNYGADDYIGKPFDEKELILKVRNLLKTLRRHREKHIKNFITTPTQIEIPSLDEQFLLKLVKVVESNIAHTDFSVEQLCKEMALSRRSMFGKIKALTKMSPSEFIRTIRLKRASQLLKQNTGSISDIAYRTGFDSPSYFAKCFKEMFDKSPSEYM